MPENAPDWFENALNRINADLGGALGTLTPDDIEVTKTAMIAAMRGTISTNPAAFRDMLTRLAPHKEQVAKAAAKTPSNRPF